MPPHLKTMTVTPISPAWEMKKQTVNQQQQQQQQQK